MLESTENIFEKPADVTEDSASPELNAARRKMIENTLSRGETLEPSQQEFYEKMQREDAENIHAAEREAAETDTVKASKTAIENTPESKGFNEEWRLSELNEFRKNWMEAKKIDKALKKGLINHWDVSQYKYTTKDGKEITGMPVIEDMEKRRQVLSDEIIDMAQVMLNEEMQERGKTGKNIERDLREEAKEAVKDINSPAKKRDAYRDLLTKTAYKIFNTRRVRLEKTTGKKVMLRSKAEALTSDAETKPVSIETPAIEETEKPQNNPEPAVEEASKQQENNDLKELEKAFEEQKTEPAVETTELKQDTETEQAKNQAEELRKFIEGAEVLKQQAAESTEAETQSPVEEKIKEEDKLIVPVPIRRTEVVSGSTEKEQKLSDYAEKLAEKSIQNLGIDSKWIEGNPKVSVALTPEEITTLDEAFKYVGEYFIKQELSSVDPTVNLSNRREYMENIGENMRKGLTHRFTNMVMFGDSWGIKGNLCLRLIINKESPKNIFKNMEDYAVISGEDVEKFVRPFADKFQGIKAELDLFLQDESEKERVRKLTGQGQEITEEQKIQKLRERDRLAQILSDRNQTEDTIIPNEIAEVKKKRSWREWAREKLGNILDM